MNASVSKRQINRQRWRERINAWGQSGQSKKVFCQRQRVALTSFQRWHRIFKAEEASARSTPVTFLPVRLREENPSNLTVVISDNLRIEVPALASTRRPCGRLLKFCVPHDRLG